MTDGRPPRAIRASSKPSTCSGDSPRNSAHRHGSQNRPAGVVARFARFAAAAAFGRSPRRSAGQAGQSARDGSGRSLRHSAHDDGTASSGDGSIRLAAEGDDDASDALLRIHGHRAGSGLHRARLLPDLTRRYFVTPQGRRIRSGNRLAGRPRHPVPLRRSHNAVPRRTGSPRFSACG